MRRERIDGPMSRWQPWRWVLAEVVPQAPGFGESPRRLYQNDSEESWLHPGFTVELFKDDAEGYFLNATAPAPCWFVLWRMEEEATLAEEPIARPAAVSLSYHDAGRWLDAQETVEQVRAPAEVVAWMRAFAEAHYTPEPRRRQRPKSFQGLQDRFGNPPSVSTEKKFGGARGTKRPLLPHREGVLSKRRRPPWTTCAPSRPTPISGPSWRAAWRPR